MADFTSIILDSLSSDGNKRTVAEQTIANLREQNFAVFLMKLAEEVSSEDKDPNLRQMAAIMCKNAVHGASEQTIKEKANKWLQIPKEHRFAIKNKFLQALCSPVAQARSGAAQVIAQFGCIEIPANEWPDLIEVLLNTVSQGNNFAKQSALETLGIICEEIAPVYLESQSNTILNTIVSGLAPGLPVETSKAAINALLGSLGFIKSNFANTEHRNYIMKVICEATQFNHREIQYIAMQCLVRVADNYYDFILEYIEAIFKITNAFIVCPHDEIAQQSVEFWSTICEVEIRKLDMMASSDDKVIFHNIIKTVIPHLFPTLATALTKQSEEQEQTWNVSTCAVACITLVAQTIEDEFIPILFPFVQNNINSADWRLREAATIALGSVLEHCHSADTVNILKSALPIFIEHMKTDTSNRVKDTTAWAIAKAAEFHSAVIFSNGIILPVLETLVLSLNLEANVASQSCYALLNVIQLFGSEGSSSNLSQIFSPLLDALIRTSERPDADEFNLRITAYESINALIANAPDDVKATIRQLLELLVDRINKTFSMDIDLEEKIEFQNYLCSVLQTIIVKMGREIAPVAPGLIELFFRVIEFVPNKIPGECLMAVASLVGEVPELITTHIDRIKNYTIASLTNYEETSVFISGIALLGSMCSLEVNLYTMDNGSFTDHVVKLLGSALNAENLPDKVKPSILNSFGEIASAIGDYAVKYLGPVMSTLANAAKITLSDEDDDDEIEYLISLRQSILETYTMFIQAFKEPQSRNALAPSIPEILNFLNLIWNDRNTSDALIEPIIGIIGDICIAYGENVRQIMIQPVVGKIIQKGLSSSDPKLQKTARWTRSVIPK